MLQRITPGVQFTARYSGQSYTCKSILNTWVANLSGRVREANFNPDRVSCQNKSNAREASASRPLTSSTMVVSDAV
jgi:hypothetical protein